MSGRYRSARTRRGVLGADHRREWRSEPTIAAAAHRSGVLWLLAAVAGLVLAPAGAAWAQPPETFTQTSTFSDHFTGPDLPCQDEPYTITATGHTIVHYDYFAETDSFFVHFSDQGTVVAVPADGSGPTYTGSFSDLDSDNVRAVRDGDVLVQKDTDLMRSIGHGSDGSLALVMTHAQLTINANGETTVQLEVDKMVCS